MKWIRFRIRTTSAAEDILVSAMQDLGLYGAQIEDNVPLTAAEKEQMFVDIMPEGREDDGLASLSFFLEENEDGTVRVDAGEGEKDERPEEIKRRIEETVKGLRETFAEIGDGTVTIEETEDIDWINNWKQYFHQFMIDDILVIPSWETPILTTDEGKQASLTFHIDPGTAFGTGMHETTQLCIRAIRKYLTNDTVLLDVGTGSGILSILSLMLGAKRAVGTDLDPCAEPAVADNLAANGVDPSLFHLILGNLINDPAVQAEVGRECYDIVVANILPDVLVPLTPRAADCLKKGGIWITSGIIEGKEELVADAAGKAGLTVLDITQQGEWRCVTARKD